MASSASERRPVVGLTTYMQEASWGPWRTEATLLPAEYTRMVVDAGGVAVLLPPHGTDPAVLDRLDGLVITGGADVGPHHYRRHPHELTRDHPWRDEHELALLAAAEARGLPVLGICRGLQVINTARGGTLHQHLPEVVGSDLHQPSPGVYGPMTAHTEPGSRIADVVGETTTSPCHHHQAVETVGAGLTVSARAEDGTIEALEGPPHEPWLLAVQWHPEHDPDDARVVAALVEAAATHSRGRGPTPTSTPTHPGVHR